MKISMVSILVAFSFSALGAGGYEKPSLWSPKAVGVGGAYGSSVSGADAIQYNPAALDQNEVGANLALLGGYLKAPIKDSSTEKTNDDLVYSGGLVASYKYSDKIGFGFGAYGLAGLDTRYEKINYGSVDPAFSNYSKDYYGNLQAVEYSLGMSYKVNSKLSFGGALRAQSFKANFGQTAVYSADGLSGMGVPDGTVLAASSAELKNLKGSAFGSYRLGMQYKEELWGVGVTYRSSVKAKLKGKSSGDMVYTGTGAALVSAGSGGMVNPNAGQEYEIGGGRTDVAADIPKQINIDTHYDVVQDKVRVLAGYSWTQYSRNEQLKLKGNLTNTLTGETIALENQNQKWKDMNDYKLGLSFLGQTTVSLGYTYTTPVTNKNYSSPNSAPAGPTHHYGASVSQVLTEGLAIDGAFEYYESSGTGKSERIVSDNMATGGQKGSYRSGVWGTYFGMRYAF